MIRFPGQQCRGTGVGAALAGATLLAGCLGQAPESTASNVRAVTVEPRVVVDGTVELGQRAGGRILIDEMIFHAPAVSERHAGGRLDVLATDPDDAGPLLFRYDIGSVDGFGDVLGGARSWVLHDDDANSTLDFAFSPFALEDSARARLEDAAGVYLGDLVGHTAYVHGYVAMSAQGEGFGSDDECDGDPDGNPAHCQRGDGDPDGNPAEPESDGDPDGNPARPRRSDEALTASADDHASDNSNDGDPDGNPAKPGPRGFARDDLVVQGRPFDEERHAATQVPFVLVLNRAFQLAVPVADLLGVEVHEEDGEVLPIDLHVSLAELFSEEQVSALVEEASRATAHDGVVLEVTDTAAVGIDVRASGVRRAAESAGSGGIRVVGDLR